MEEVGGWMSARVAATVDYILWCRPPYNSFEHPTVCLPCRVRLVSDQQRTEFLKILSMLITVFNTFRKPTASVCLRLEIDALLDRWGPLLLLSLIFNVSPGIEHSVLVTSDFCSGLTAPAVFRAFAAILG